jgi:hypothetical protein
MKDHSDDRREAGRMCMRAARMVLAAGLLAIPLVAQSADDVISRNLAARGGKEKVLAISTVRASGRIAFSPELAGTFVSERKGTTMTRMEITLQGRTIVRVFDGKAGWVVNPFATGSFPVAMSAEELRNAAEEADPNPYYDYQAKGNRVELVGRVQVGGKDADRLRVTLANGDRVECFFDAASGLVVKSEVRRMDKGKAVIMEDFASDQRPVDGVMFPFRTGGRPQGAPAEQQIRVTFERIELGVPIADERFGKPAAARAAP